MPSISNNSNYSKIDVKVDYENHNLNLNLNNIDKTNMYILCSNCEIEENKVKSIDYTNFVYT